VDGTRPAPGARSRVGRAIITGGSSGVGLALAHGLACDGSDLTLFAITPERLAAAKRADGARGLDYLRCAGVEPDDRIAQAVGLVEKHRFSDGRWPLQNPHPGQRHFAMEGGADEPSRWNTLRALRVLRWAENS
jgi:NAD(P)-dependent dehydrogenase (short-subunit alcohol dehydrogenase family)